ncbi:hypothetical protein GOODEAATRI_028235 [Goodea atripinnis]|uniref:Secreted protein n=1 Tax=Goodea atripinnis TaxID=208336 RepID=A0ABV0MVU5_9TELE
MKIHQCFLSFSVCFVSPPFTNHRSILCVSFVPILYCTMISVFANLNAACTCIDFSAVNKEETLSCLLIYKRLLTEEQNHSTNKRITFKMLLFLLHFFHSLKG